MNNELIKFVLWGALGFGLSLFCLLTGFDEARSQGCPPNKPHARQVRDFTTPPACDIKRCPSKLVCDTDGPCIRVPQPCPQCEPHAAVVTCLSNQEVRDAERGNRPVAPNKPNGKL